MDECGALPEKKVAFLIGDQWFMNEAGCTPEAFLNSFSEEAFCECMENPGLSVETKAQIRERVIALGVDAQTVSDLASDSIVGRANRAVSDFVSGSERRALLAEGLASNGGLSGMALRLSGLIGTRLTDRAVEEGKTACTNNDYGIYDEYFDTYVSDAAWGQPYEGEPFAGWSETEFGDLQLFLTVCKELGITPLLVIEPVNGEYYDIQRYTKESRAEFYGKLSSVLDEAEVDYLDLSGHDYDKYYLRDVMHLGWKGWVEDGSGAVRVLRRRGERSGMAAAPPMRFALGRMSVERRLQRRMPRLLPTKCWKWKVPGKRSWKTRGLLHEVAGENAMLVGRAP